MKLPEAFLPWRISCLVYRMWRFREKLVRNRYRLFFSVWRLVKRSPADLASSKRFSDGVDADAAVLAAEYCAVLLQMKAGQRGNAQHHRRVVGAGAAMYYLGALPLVRAGLTTPVVRCRWSGQIRTASRG